MSKLPQDANITLRGKLVHLRPTTTADKHQVYEWGNHSDITKSMKGPPTFPDQPVTAWDDFDRDYKDYYFDGSQPELGRGFLICTGEEAVGFIDYNDIDFVERYVELDIWLKSSKYCGRGYGTDAILTLCAFLKDKYNLEYAIIAPSRRNSRAVAAYRKAGFTEVPMSTEEAKAKYGDGDYYDAVYMRKELSV
jgi:RimJ/RimL family protein N-acetyltransferase